MQAGFRDMEQKYLPTRPQSYATRLAARLTITVFWLLSGTTHLHALKDHAAPNPGFVTEFAASIEDVLQALQEVLRSIHPWDASIRQGIHTYRGDCGAVDSAFRALERRRQGFLQDS